MNEIAASVIISGAVLASGLYCIVLHKVIGPSDDIFSFRIFFPIWLLFFVAEYLFLGPNSYIDMNVDDLAVIMNNYLTDNYDGGQFSHAIGGGQDLYVWFLGKQYFQPEKIFAAIFPTWITILVHKLMVGSLAFVGAFMLSKKAVPSRTLIPLAMAVVYPVSHLYLTDYSMSFGTGFAAIPLAVYWCVARTDARRYWWFVALSALILSAADPMKVFPALAVAFIGALILFRPANYKRPIGAFGIIVVAAIINWHEVIYALAISSPFIARGWSGGTYGGVTALESFGITLLILKNYWPASGLFLTSLIIMFYRKVPHRWPSLLVGVWVLFALTVADIFPWDAIGLPFLNRLAHQQYMSLALGTIAIPVASWAFEGFEKVGFLRFNVRPVLVLMGLALGVLTWQKADHLVTLVALGGQSEFTDIKALAKPSWKPKPYYRTVTFYEKPSANIVAGFYGFEAFDGQLNLNNQRWADYWAALLRDSKNHNLTTRLGWRWNLWDGKSYDVEKHVNLNLLAAANVRYLFSPLPLRGRGIRLLHAPPRDEWMAGRIGMYGGIKSFLWHRLKRIFDAGDIFVYEITNTLPRIFAARDILALSDYGNGASFYDTVASVSMARGVVVSEADAKKLGKPLSLSVLSYKEVVDGYDVEVNAPDGGVIVVNATYWPFWKAWVDDRKDVPLHVVAANGVHMAVSVPPGAGKIKIRYKRPMLRDKLTRIF